MRWAAEGSGVVAGESCPSSLGSCVAFRGGGRSRGPSCSSTTTMSEAVWAVRGRMTTTQLDRDRGGTSSAMWRPRRTAWSRTGATGVGRLGRSTAVRHRRCWEESSGNLPVRRTMEGVRCFDAAAMLVPSGSVVSILQPRGPICRVDRLGRDSGTAQTTDQIRRRSPHHLESDNERDSQAPLHALQYQSSGVFSSCRRCHVFASVVPQAEQGSSP